MITGKLPIFVLAHKLFDFTFATPFAENGERERATGWASGSQPRSPYEGNLFGTQYWAQPTTLKLVRVLRSSAELAGHSQVVRP